MLKSKSVFNGLGSASGVAWPSFGIMTALLGASIGGPISLGLGIICTILFFTIGIPIVYFSYQEIEQHQQQLQTKADTHQRCLFASIDQYIQTIKRFHSQKEKVLPFHDYLQRVINNDLDSVAKTDYGSPLYQLLFILKSSLHNAIRNRQVILETIRQQHISIPIPNAKILIPALYGFVGTFGSIAGFSAGFSGLLTGMGLFAGFTAFPILGWGVLITATLVGINSAIQAAQEASQEYQQQNLTSLTKKMHQQLSQLSLKRTVDIQLYQMGCSLITAKAEPKQTIARVSTSNLFGLNSSNNQPHLHLSLLFRSLSPDSQPSDSSTEVLQYVG